MQAPAATVARGAGRQFAPVIAAAWSQASFVTWHESRLEHAAVVNRLAAGVPPGLYGRTREETAARQAAAAVH